MLLVELATQNGIYGVLEKPEACPTAREGAKNLEASFFGLLAADIHWDIHSWGPYPTIDLITCKSVEFRAHSIF